MFDRKFFKDRIKDEAARTLLANKLAVKMARGEMLGLLDKLIVGARTANETHALASGRYRELSRINANNIMLDAAAQEVQKANAVAVQARLFMDQLYRTLRYTPTTHCEAYVRMVVEHRNGLYASDISTLRELMERVEGNVADGDKMMEYMTSRFSIETCEDCGGWEFSDQALMTWGDERICRRCRDNTYQFSDYYQRYVHYDDGRWARDANNNEVYISQSDESFIWNDDADCYVHEEWEPPQPPIIANYHSSKGRFAIKIDDWSRETGLFFGTELEVEVRDGDRFEVARRVNDVVNGGEVGRNVFFENDGSLNHGFEIISHPMSLPAHRDLWKWTQDRAAVRGLRSHNTETCGLHVHISRAELTGMQIAKMIAFVNDPENEHLIRAIARRYATGYCKIKKKDVDEDLTALDSGDRYEAVNITPRRTIELRIFKGSLNYQAIIAALEFSNALCAFTKGTKFMPEHLKSDRFLDFINNSYAHETQILRPYIGNRMGLSLDGQNRAEAEAENNITA